MVTDGLTGYMIANDMVMSCVTSVTRSSEDGICIVELEGNQAMVSEIISDFVILIHTV